MDKMDDRWIRWMIDGCINVHYMTIYHNMIGSKITNITINPEVHHQLGEDGDFILVKKRDTPETGH